MTGPHRRVGNEHDRVPFKQRWQRCKRVVSSQTHPVEKTTAVMGFTQPTRIFSLSVVGTRRLTAVTVCWRTKGDDVAPTIIPIDLEAVVLFDGAPVAGTRVNFVTLLQSDHGFRVPYDSPGRPAENSWSLIVTVVNTVDPWALVVDSGEDLPWDSY
jgi:hypothetical protein